MSSIDHRSVGHRGEFTSVDRTNAIGAVFEAKFMLPWSFTREAAAETHMAQLWVTVSRIAVLSIIAGGGKWVEMTIPADPLSSARTATAANG